MTCKRPPELMDREILAHLEGEANAEVAAHLKVCAHCRERAQQLASLKAGLIRGLYRVTCPSSEELGEHHLGLLPRDRRVAVSQHLAECPHCSREVALLEAYLKELAPEVALGPVEQVKVLVAELVRGIQGMGLPQTWAPAPALVGVRGEAAGPLLYEADDYQIAIEFQADGQQQDRQVLLGLVTAVGPAVGLGGLTAHLWRAERLLTSVPVDELGNFVIPNLTPASYELILSGPEVEIHIQALEIGAP